MNDRFVLLPDPRFEALQSTLQQRVMAAAEELEPRTLPGAMDPLMRGILEAGFRAARADNGMIWLADGAREHLAAAYGTGPRAAALVQQEYRQPLRSGLSSMVYASEQPFCENEVYRNAGQDKTVDRALGMLTCAMIAVPFYYARRIRGVISCVQTKPAGTDEPDPRGFSVADMRHVQLASEVLSRLLDHWLISVSVGWQPE